MYDTHHHSHTSASHNVLSLAKIVIPYASILYISSTPDRYECYSLYTLTQSATVDKAKLSPTDHVKIIIVFNVSTKLSGQLYLHSMAWWDKILMYEKIRIHAERERESREKY